MNWKVLSGIMLITLGVGLFLYYDYNVRPEREAREMLAEAKMIYERGDEAGDRNTINQSITLFTKLIARYPETKPVQEAYYYIGKSYENLNLYRLAYLKYSSILRNNHPDVSDGLKKDIMVRLARINVMKQYSEEGVHQLYSLLNNSSNREFRARVYSELGHTYLKTREFNRAKRMFDIALHENGGNEEALLGKARAFMHMGQDNQAYDLYEYFLRYYGAISQYSKDVRNSYRDQAYRSGLRAYRGGNHWNAISYFNRLLRNFPYDSKAENALYWTGESYFAMNRFDKALGYFDRVLSNGHYQKDQDAQIKKGYAYFSIRKFDLAAREFQRYLSNYPRGRYSHVARQWKNMSTKELLYRIEAQRLPSVQNREERSSDSEDSAPQQQQQNENEFGDLGDEEISGTDEFRTTDGGERINLENVAEL